MIFFFNDTATTEIYTLSLHDALPILRVRAAAGPREARAAGACGAQADAGDRPLDLGKRRRVRSEEHTSELQSHSDLVCRLLLEKKKHTQYNDSYPAQRRNQREEHRER